MMSRDAIRQSGVSLVELIVFIIIVSVAVAGVLSVFTIATRGSADPMIRKQMLAVAESMMEEVLTKDFENPPGGFTPAAPGNPTQGERASLDDVVDYNMSGGWKWTGVKSLGDPVTNIAYLSGLSVEVSVSGTALHNAPATAAKRITVTVSGATGYDPITLVGYRTNY